MKVAVFMATYNKNNVLANTLYSISKQKTSFPFEVYIIDDCSNIDPGPIIKKFLPKAKYKRLEKHVGFVFSQSRCWDLMPSDVDVVVVQACDVILAQPFAIETLCKNVGSKKITLSEVVDVNVDTNMYNNFEVEVSHILGNWEQYAYKASTVCTGRKRPKSWLFFLGAIRRDDLESIGFRDICCDAVLDQTMKMSGFQADLLCQIKGIHQLHPRAEYECPIVDSCRFYCSRTHRLKRTPPGKSLGVNIIK